MTKYVIVIAVAIIAAIAWFLSRRGEESGPERVFYPRLLAFPPPDHRETVLAERPDAEAVRSAVIDHSWEEISFITVKRSEGDWMEVSGSIRPEDGFSARYSLSGEEHISVDPPESVEDLADLLVSFLENDGRWKSRILWD